MKKYRIEFSDEKIIKLKCTYLFQAVNVAEKHVTHDRDIYGPHIIRSIEDATIKVQPRLQTAGPELVYTIFDLDDKRYPYPEEVWSTDPESAWIQYGNEVFDFDFDGPDPSQ